MTTGATTPTGVTLRSRLTSLDGLRGLAALAVVVYHFGFRASELYPELGSPITAVSFGHYGVQLFFVISGFVIFMSLERATVRSFVINRFIRLYPIYWICLIATFVIVLIFGLPGREVSPLEAVVNLTMFQGYFGVTHVDGAYWTLVAELGFYIQIGVLYFTGMLTGKRALPTLYVWLVLSVVASQAYRVLPGLLGDIAKNISLGLIWIPLFICGIVFYRLWKGERSIALYALPVLALAAMFVRDRELAVASVVIFALFALALWGPSLILRTRPLIFLGEISFVLYLLHQNIGYVIMRGLHSVGVPQLAAIVIALVVLIAASGLVTYFIDVPLRRALKRRLLPARSVDSPPHTVAP